MNKPLPLHLPVTEQQAQEAWDFLQNLKTEPLPPVMDEDTANAVQTIAEALLENAIALRTLADLLMVNTIDNSPELEEECGQEGSCDGSCHSC